MGEEGKPNGMTVIPANRVQGKRGQRREHAGLVWVTG